MLKTLQGKFKAWIKARKLHRATKRYERGYKLGMRLLNSYKTTPVALYRRTVFQESSMQRYTEFHAGVRAACCDYQAQDARIKATVAGTY